MQRIAHEARRLVARHRQKLLKLIGIGKIERRRCFLRDFSELLAFEVFAHEECLAGAGQAVRHLPSWNIIGASPRLMQQALRFLRHDVGELCGAPYAFLQRQLPTVGGNDRELLVSVLRAFCSIQAAERFHCFLRRALRAAASRRLHFGTKARHVLHLHGVRRPPDGGHSEDAALLLPEFDEFLCCRQRFTPVPVRRIGVVGVIGQVLGVPGLFNGKHLCASEILQLVGFAGEGLRVHHGLLCQRYHH